MPGKLNRIRELSRHLAARTQDQGEQQSLEHLQNLTEQLRGPVDGIVRQTERCRILSVGVDSGSRTQLRKKLTKLRTQLREDPGAVGQGTVFQQFRDALVEVSGNLRQAADAAWNARRDRVVEIVPSSMLPLWETIPDLRDDAAEVRKLLSAVQPQGRPIQDPDQLRAFVSKCGEIEERAERLNSFEAPPAVRSFLEAARTSAGARWDRLTEEVREWLDQHQLLDSVRIKLG